MTIADPGERTECLEEIGAALTSMAAIEAGLTPTTVYTASEDCCGYLADVLLYDPDRFGGALQEDYPRVCEMP